MLHSCNVWSFKGIRFQNKSSVPLSSRIKQQICVSNHFLTDQSQVFKNIENSRGGLTLSACWESVSASIFSGSVVSASERKHPALATHRKINRSACWMITVQQPERTAETSMQMTTVKQSNGGTSSCLKWKITRIKVMINTTKEWLRVVKVVCTHGWIQPRSTTSWVHLSVC